MALCRRSAKAQAACLSRQLPTSPKRTTMLLQLFQATHSYDHAFCLTTTQAQSQRRSALVCNQAKSLPVPPPPSTRRMCGCEQPEACVPCRYKYVLCHTSQTVQLRQLLPACQYLKHTCLSHVVVLPQCKPAHSPMLPGVRPGTRSFSACTQCTHIRHKITPTHWVQHPW